MAVDRLGELRRNEEYTQRSTSAMEQEVTPVIGMLEDLRDMTRRLEEEQAEYLASGSKKTQKRIDQLIEDVNKKGASAKGMIQAMNEKTKRMAANGADETEIRMRNHQFTNLSKKLIEVTKGAWDMQNAHQSDVKGQVSRRLRIRYTNPDGTTTLSEQDAQRLAAKLVETGNHDQIFLLARDELEKAMQTRDEVLELERCMKELHQMFCDLNMLIMDQGEGLDVVQATVQTAADRVEAGNRDLYHARRIQQKTCCTMM